MAADLPEKLARLERFEPVILTVELDQKYERLAWLKYVEALIDYPEFAFAALLDDDGRPLAFMGVDTVHELLSSTALGRELIRLIAAGEAEDIARFPGVHRQWVSPRSGIVST